MPSNLAESAIIHADATLAPDVVVGPYAVIGAHVTIGAGTVIGPHVRIDGPTTIGERDINPACALNDMTVGQDESIRRKNEAGPTAMHVTRSLACSR